MPAGKRWSKTLHQWVKKAEPRPVDYSQQDEDSWALLLSYFRWYPDRLLELSQDEDADFNQQLIQCLIWRIDARYKETFVTGTRGLTKTFTKMAGSTVEILVWPKERIRYFGPTMNQAADLAKAAFEQVAKNYPVLTNQLMVKASNDGEFWLIGETGSEFRVTVKRGDNCHHIICEECGQEDEYPFDHERYQTVVDPTNRLRHMVNNRADPTHVDFKKQYITSACSQQNEAFKYRCDIFNDMLRGKSAFAIDIPWTVPVLSGIRDIEYYKGLRRNMTPEKWLRECESIYTGEITDPVISDVALTKSQVLKVAELEHCKNPDCCYVIGYDVSHEQGAHQAKCAVSVVKLTKQTDKYKEDVFLKQIVYLNDMPTKEASEQAQYLKRMWMRYTMLGGNYTTYIAIDDRQYGKSVTEQLMKDMGDGMTLCCVNHEYLELEVPGSLPVIYPVKASNAAKDTGNGDPDGDMIKYAKFQFEQGNVLMLVTDHYVGLDAYKKANHITNSGGDAEIVVPYLKAHEMSQQIKNLRIKYRSNNWSEERISRMKQRDMWSATKYALRMAQLLERKKLIQSVHKKKDWAPLIQQAQKQHAIAHYRPRVMGRRGRVS